MDSTEAALAALEKHELIARWQEHRMFCLKLAIKLDAASPEQAIEMAEAFSVYILNGRPKEPESEHAAVTKVRACA